MPGKSRMEVLDIRIIIVRKRGWRSESFVQNVSRNISASGQLTWNTPVDGLSFIGKVGMNYWTKYDKAYRADTYFDESKTVGTRYFKCMDCK